MLPCVQCCGTAINLDSRAAVIYVWDGATEHTQRGVGGNGSIDEGGGRNAPWGDAASLKRWPDRETSLFGRTARYHAHNTVLVPYRSGVSTRQEEEKKPKSASAFKWRWCTESRPADLCVVLRLGSRHEVNSSLRSREARRLLQYKVYGDALGHQLPDFVPEKMKKNYEAQEPLT